MIESAYTGWAHRDTLLTLTACVVRLVEVITVRVDVRAYIVDKCVALETSGTKTVGVLSAVRVDTHRWIDALMLLEDVSRHTA